MIGRIMTKVNRFFGITLVCLSMVSNSFSSNLFDSAKQLGGLDKIKEKLSKEISNGKKSLGKYANDSLTSSLGGVDLSGILSGSQDGFKADLNNGVTNVVKSSLDYSKGLKSPQLSNIVQSLAPFIESTINSSIGSFDMGEAASSLFKSKFFQENITGFLSKFISGNMSKGIVPEVDSNLVQSLSQDFFKSPGFLESIASFASQKLMAPKESSSVGVDVPKPVEDPAEHAVLQKLQNVKELQAIPQDKYSQEVKVVTKAISTKLEAPKPTQEKEESKGWMDYIKGLLGY